MILPTVIIPLHASNRLLAHSMSAGTGRFCLASANPVNAGKETLEALEGLERDALFRCLESED